MLRIPEAMLDCVCYMYPSEEAALEGRRTGGTGFFVLVPVEGTEALMAYVVTARHVVEMKGCTVVRMNNKGRDDVVPVDLPLESWSWPEDGTDIAVSTIRGPWSTVSAQGVPVSEFMTRQLCRDRSIGIGSPVFMAGRLRYHDGRLLNKPAARFGQISMMPDAPIWNDDIKSEQVSFVVEMRSIGGFSGSPVWVYDVDKNWPALLLGVDWGHLHERTRSGARENANMACIAPAWDLMDLLYSEDMVAERRKMIDEAGGPPTDRNAASTDAMGDEPSKPGPDPERLSLDGTMRDVARRVMEAGRPEDEEDY